MNSLFSSSAILVDEDLLSSLPSSAGRERIIPFRPGLNIDTRRIRHTFIISDRPEAIEVSKKYKCTLLFVLTDRGLTHLDKLPLSWFVFHTQEDALNWIKAHPAGKEDFIKDLREGANVIRKGGLVAFPTETVYGLGADALNEEAVVRIFEAKERPLHDPLIVHVETEDQIKMLVPSIPPSARKLMDKFWPGPLTLVLPKSPLVPDLITAGLPSVAIRMPANPWARKLISLAGTPIAAPSANLFGKTSPTCARHVKEQLEGRYDFIVDGGACRIGIESTVLSLVGPCPVILRPGGITYEDIEATIGPVEKKSPPASNHRAKLSPGMLDTHYAPHTPMMVVSDVGPYLEKKDVGLITLRKPVKQALGPLVSLSSRGDLREAATNLYRAMRELDRMGLKLIIVERMPDMGLGSAINDRLKRASQKTTE
ncbi:MAG: L-threonylcarbamoyladenylate synthase [Syntrophales bacterium]|nr:L-threonylcarbamoyladenylate synthase [Syntrophales bacterium]